MTDFRGNKYKLTDHLFPGLISMYLQIVRKLFLKLALYVFESVQHFFFNLGNIFGLALSMNSVEGRERFLNTKHWSLKDLKFTKYSLVFKNCFA